MRVPEFFRAIRQANGADPGRVQLMLAADSAAFLEAEVASDVIAPPQADKSFRLAEREKPILGLILMAGPREDGATANGGTIFIGGQGVGLKDGYPLLPGMTLAIDAVDLSKLAAYFTNASDRLRLLYLA